MIGRFANAGTMADIGARRAATVGAAAALLVSGAIAAAAGWERTSAILALASLSLTGFPIVWSAARGLARLKSNVDELVSLAILASLVLGEWLSAAIVAFIMVLGALIEGLVSARARRHLEALVAAQPRHAWRLSAAGAVEQVRTADLRPGDRILVKPGDVIAADGLVEDGESQVDESLLTGESAPADRGPGDLVSGGTINESGSLTVRVERVGQESAHGKVLRLIEEAESHRAPILRAAEAYARWFTPAVLTLAGIVWTASGDVHRAVTMLIVGCPCAFALATPTAIVAAISRAAREGLLIKGGRYVEGCAGVSAIAFDKTGTLTMGECRVVDVVPADGTTPAGLLAAAARLEAAADHPLARAVQARAAADGVAVSESLAILREAGLGITGQDSDGRGVWRLGNARFMARHGVDVGRLETDAARLRDRGLSIVYVARGGEAKGLLSIQDEVRPEAREVIAALRADGLGDVRILSGDARPVALAVAAAVGVDPANVSAELLPEQKYEQVQTLEREHGRLCYVGDGANDGPALSVATVGVSLGSRHDTVALETAAVVLMRNSLSALPFLFRLSRRTTRTINTNLVFFGLLFNAGMLALSSAGILTPILGALAHNVGSVSVVLNSARLLLFERRRAATS